MTVRYGQQVIPYTLTHRLAELPHQFQVVPPSQLEHDVLIFWLGNPPATVQAGSVLSLNGFAHCIQGRYWDPQVDGYSTSCSVEGKVIQLIDQNNAVKAQTTLGGWNQAYGSHPWALSATVPTVNGTYTWKVRFPLQITQVSRRLVLRVRA